MWTQLSSLVRIDVTTNGDTRPSMLEMYAKIFPAINPSFLTRGGGGKDGHPCQSGIPGDVFILGKYGSPGKDGDDFSSLQPLREATKETVVKGKVVYQLSGGCIW